MFPRITDKWRFLITFALVTLAFPNVDYERKFVSVLFIAVTKSASPVDYITAKNSGSVTKELAVQ